MKRCLLSLLLLVPSSVLAVEISVGTARLSIPSPAGYSPITSDMQPYADLAKRFVPPSNEQFALFLPAADAAAAARGEIAAPQRSFYVQTSKALIQPFVSTADFAQLKQILKTQNENILKKVESEMPGIIEKINKGISADYNVDLNASLDQTLPLPPHYEAEGGLAYSMLFKYKVNDEEGNPYFFEGVTTLTIVDVQVRYCICMRIPRSQDLSGAGPNPGSGQMRLSQPTRPKET